MKPVVIIARRELHSFFNSAVAYIAVTLFLGLTAVWFFAIYGFAARDFASLRGYFGLMPFLFIVLLPAITMRSWAEENKSGTAELLLTMPFSELQLVLGKFLGALVLVLIMLAFTLAVPLTVLPLARFEIGEIVGQYVGTVLLACAGLSLGQFVSSLSRNQISAFLISSLLLLLISVLHVVNAVSALPRVLALTVNHLSLLTHYESFARGLIDSRGVVHYALLTVAFLYLSARVLVIKKWS
ncbi:MAG: ABC transporter permease [Spirochaetaceae bacterium]|nr:MAG: ABC transporter permease [Spirochaetaceae bacterium]